MCVPVHYIEKSFLQGLTRSVNNTYAPLSWTKHFPMPQFSSPPAKNLLKAIHWQGSQLKKLSPLCSVSLSTTLESHPLNGFASSEANQAAKDSDILSLHMTSAGNIWPQVWKASSAEIFAPSPVRQKNLQVGFLWMHLHWEQLWNKATGGCRDGFTSPACLIGNTRIFFLATDISRDSLLSEVQSMCAVKFEVSHMTFMSFITISGKKMNQPAAHLFLIKMGCLFCFLLTTENHHLSKQSEKPPIFHCPCLLWL